jgi:hypothetical protein
MHLARWTVASLFISVSALAQSAPMPYYDVERHCRRIASFGGSYSATLYDGCLDMEQNAYDNLKPYWSSLPSAMRQHCDRIARSGGGNYTILEGCVQMEESASRRSSGREFRR